MTIFLPWVREACAEDPGLSATPLAETEATQPVVTAIGVVKSKTGTQITISGNFDLSYEYFVIEGRSLAIDIPGARSTVWPAEQQVDDEFVSRIQVAAQTGGKSGVRVALALKKPDGFTVRGENGRIVVLFPTQQGSASPSRPPLNRVFEVTATRIANAFRVAVKTDAKPSYRILESGDTKRIVVAIDSAQLEPDSRKASDYANLDTPVTRIATWSEPKDPTVVLVAIDLRQPLPFRVFTDGYGLNVDFSIAVSGGTESVSPVPISQALTPGSTLSDPPAVSVMDPARVARNYTGRKITLDFLDADIADIFRLIADVAQMNIIASDDVKGKRSVKMTEVPWDRALDLILKTNIPQLSQISDGDNVVRIVTLSRLLQEQAETEKKKIEALKLQGDSRKLEQLREDALVEAKLFMAKKQKREEITALAVREPLKDYKISLNNAEMQDVWRDIKTHLQEREIITLSSAAGRISGVVAGTSQAENAGIEWRINEETCPNCLISIDTRTKTIFFKMYPLYMEKVLYIVNILDTPKRIDSVLIEARIVEVVSDLSQALGVQWGGTFAADAAHGNATSYAFPNSINIGGGVQQGETGLNPGTFMVNLPATGATSGIGLSLGHIANTLSLDIKLSALEKMGKTKILSNPKILTLNNKAAKINIGSQLPIPKTDSTGSRSVEWKDVGILLDVTPEITSDDKVVMKVNIEKSSRGVTVSTTDGEMFSIERRGAATNVIVADGETTVIGGIFIQSDSDNNSSVPGLSKIPLLGWLFKTNSKSTDRTELMIFLTPRINRYR